MNRRNLTHQPISDENGGHVNVSPAPPISIKEGVARGLMERRFTI